MSSVTNVVLSFGILENRDARLREVNDYFDLTLLHPLGCVERGFFSPSPRSYAGGSKVLEHPTFIGAFNYLGPEDFVAHVKKVHWEYPENVQLFLCAQDEERYTERLHED